MPTLGIEEKWLLGWQGYVLGTYLSGCEGEEKCSSRQVRTRDFRL